jgi:NAD(P)H-dependent flavin oxidoreductase YrpB (nitropropane dioxygenase family)
VTGARHLSQAISEGDGISLLAPVDDAAAAAAAERDGAEGIVLAREIPGLPDATGLPILWSGEASAQAAARAGADAFVLRVEADDGERLHQLHLQAHDLGLEPVVAVSDEEQLALALEQVDPEIFLLSARPEDEEDPLEGVLDLLPDVPAGKLAIAEVLAPSREIVLALERAGVDGVVVRAGDVSRLVGGAPPEV